MNGLNTPVKSKVRFHATRHHLTSQIVLLPEADFAAYTQLLDDYAAEYDPKTESEKALVAQIANATWRLNQSQTYEMTLMALHFNPSHPNIAGGNPVEVEDALGTAAALEPRSKDLANLSLYRTREYRILEKAMAKLEALQTARKAKEEAALEEAANLMRLHQAEQEQLEQESNETAPFVAKPYLPAEDGFVFSAPEIVTYANRKFRADEAKRLNWRTDGAPLKAAA